LYSRRLRGGARRDCCADLRSAWPSAWVAPQPSGLALAAIGSNP